MAFRILTKFQRKMDANDFSGDDASFCSFDDSVSDYALLGTFKDEYLYDTTGHGQQVNMKVYVDLICTATRSMFRRRRCKVEVNI